MSGKAIRRRAKLVKAANQGNLAKAQRGRASANLPLPSAPTKDDYVEKVPASLRRMMALKAAAVQPPAKKQKVEQQQQQQQQQQQKPGSKPPTLQKQPSQQQQQQQHQTADGSAAQAGGKTPHRNTAGASSAAVAAPAAAAAAANSSGAIWEQPKRLKQRKKDYLNAKKLKKKGKRPPTDQEMDVDRPAFGEVVHAPPKVHLKRKHWDPAATKAAQEQQQQQQQAGAKQRQKQRQKQQQAPAMRRQKQDPALLELREQAIEGYRAGRGPREGHATLDTLKQLVK